VIRRDLEDATSENHRKATLQGKKNQIQTKEAPRRKSKHGSYMNPHIRFLSIVPLFIIAIFTFNAPKCHSANSIEDLKKAAVQGNAQAQYELGWAYFNGNQVSKNPAEAGKWWRKAADQGHVDAQFWTATSYKYANNFAEAIKWYLKAAKQGHVDSQNNLALCYVLGEGVPKNEIEALAWFNIAAASGDKDAVKSREMLEGQIGSQARLLAQQRSKEILNEIESTKNKKAQSKKASPNKPKDSDVPKGSGSGVFLTNDGLILTAAHVVHDSTGIKVGTQQGFKSARIVKLDNANDLALLKCEGSFQSAPVKSSSGIKLGSSVFTIGFPNIEFQGFSPKMTKGEISSLSGLQDDPRHWQISVPVQPGNSGGPLFDEAGNVVGVVLSKLDAIKVAKFTGDLPQNVNYAVKSIYALPLLEPYRAKLAPETAASTSPKMLESVVEKVQGAVVLILVY
jgi:S1-C subfamily serine protease